MTDTFRRVSNSQLSKNPDYNVKVTNTAGDVLDGDTQHVLASIAANAEISLSGPVTVDAGQSWVEALFVGDSILSNTSAMLALVDDGTSHAAALRQPTTPADTQPVSGTFWQATQPVSIASVPSHAVTNAGTFAVQESGDLLIELKVLNQSYAMRTDAASATVTYQGWAAPGTATSAASWRIKRITESTGDFALEFAAGSNAFNQVWDNRASLSYS